VPSPLTSTQLETLCYEQYKAVHMLHLTASAAGTTTDTTTNTIAAAAAHWHLLNLG